MTKDSAQINELENDKWNKTVSLYDTNEVMRLIGFQNSKPLIDGGINDLKWVASAHGYKGKPDMLIDSFLLGAIYGKRAVRLERKSAQR